MVCPCENIVCALQLALAVPTCAELEVEPEIELWVESFTQVGAFDEMDILWVIDGSCSMNSHHAQLLLGVEAMMNNLIIILELDLTMTLSSMSSLPPVDSPSKQ